MKTSISRRMTHTVVLGLAVAAVAAPAASATHAFPGGPHVVPTRAATQTVIPDALDRYLRNNPSTPVPDALDRYLRNNPGTSAVRTAIPGEAAGSHGQYRIAPFGLTRPAPAYRNVRSAAPVRSTTPVAEPTGGFSWGDAAIGAVLALMALALAALAARAVSRRRRPVASA